MLDETGQARGFNVLNQVSGVCCQRRSFRPGISGAPFSPPSSVLDRVVSVSVGERQFSLPEYAVQKGLSDLRLATGECVSLRDYVQGVGLVLVALANDDSVIDLALLQSRD